MATDDPGALLRDAADGPVAPLDHDQLRRRARRRTRSQWSAAGVALVATIVGVVAVLGQLAQPRGVDVLDAPDGSEAQAGALPGLPTFPVTLDVPAVGEVATAHVGERPVFVVHGDGGVVVLDAISPHWSEVGPQKVIALCREPWVFESADGERVVATPGVLRDLWHGSAFALDGAWLGGPSPTGLPTYQVLSRLGQSIEIGPPGPAPERGVGPFADELGQRSDIAGRSVPDGESGCENIYDQTGEVTRPDPADVLWHEPVHADRWAYPFQDVTASAGADDRLAPLTEGERATTAQPPTGGSMDAVLIISAFVVAVVALGVVLRRREADGSLDPGRSSVSRPGLRRLFDFGPGGWSRDGRNQRPRD